jgi:hypothetical protein
MSRKDYEKIAGLLDALRSSGECDNCTLEEVARGLAVIFHVDNPRFDRDRFMEACGVEVKRGLY